VSLSVTGEAPSREVDWMDEDARDWVTEEVDAVDWMVEAVAIDTVNWVDMISRGDYNFLIMTRQN